MKKWLYFNYDDFACKCCGENEMAIEVIDKLDQAREIAGIPFVINSGYRCPEHNAAEGSSSDVHPNGLAADVSVTNSVNRLKVVKALIEAGFTRIGVARTFIHGDLDNTKVDCMWVY